MHSLGKDRGEMPPDEELESAEFHDDCRRIEAARSAAPGSEVYRNVRNFYHVLWCHPLRAVREEDRRAEADRLLDGTAVTPSDTSPPAPELDRMIAAALGEKKSVTRKPGWSPSFDTSPYRVFVEQRTFLGVPDGEVGLSSDSQDPAITKDPFSTIVGRYDAEKGRSFRVFLRTWIEWRIADAIRSIGYPERLRSIHHESDKWEREVVTKAGGLSDAELLGRRWQMLMDLREQIQDTGRETDPALFDLHLKTYIHPDRFHFVTTSLLPGWRASWYSDLATEHLDALERAVTLLTVRIPNGERKIREAHEALEEAVKAYSTDDRARKEVEKLQAQGRAFGGQVGGVGKVEKDLEDLESALKTLCDRPAEEAKQRRRIRAWKVVLAAARLELRRVEQERLVARRPPTAPESDKSEYQRLLDFEYPWIRKQEVLGEMLRTSQSSVSRRLGPMRERLLSWRDDARAAQSKQ